MACLCETKVNLKRVGIFCKIFLQILLQMVGGVFAKNRLKVCGWGKKRDKKTCFKILDCGFCLC